MMEKMGFPPQFMSLIKWCISTPSISITINGTLGFILSNRGIGQDDPLSSYLFTIAMEYLSVNLESEHLQGNLSPSYNIDPVLMHLIYANHLLLFSKATIESTNSFKSGFNNMDNYVG